MIYGILLYVSRYQLALMEIMGWGSSRAQAKVPSGDTKYHHGHGESEPLPSAMLNSQVAPVLEKGNLAGDVMERDMKLPRYHYTRHPDFADWYPSAISSCRQRNFHARPVDGCIQLTTNWRFIL